MIDRVYNSIKFTLNPNDVYDVNFIKQYLASGKNDYLIDNKIVTNSEDKVFDAGSKYRFKKIFSNNKNWTVENNQLVYTNNGLKRIVVPREQVLAKLIELYGDSKYIGVGLNAFYSKIAEEYIGITRKQASEFLKREPLYQLTRPDIHKINKPGRAKERMQTLHIDLIDMNPYIGFNRQYRYILSCIDAFTKKVFVRGMLRKTLEETVENLESVIQEAGVTPNKIQCDLGREFSLDAWGRENGVTIVHSRSYQPQSNGLVENINRQIRKVLSAFFIRNGNTNWIDHLDELRDNLNSNRHGVTKTTPDNLYQTNNEATKLKARVRIDARAKKILSKDTIFQVGDLVRIKNSALYSKVREKIKDGGKKNIIVTFSPEIFRVYQIVRNRNQGYENTRYMVKRLDGSLLVAENLRNPNAEPNEKRLFGNELIKAYAIEDEPLITTQEANRMNSMKAPVIDPVLNPALNPQAPVAPVIRNNNAVVHQVQYEPREPRQRVPNRAIFNADYLT
jgi:hypothetical protein